jgi:NAD(P)-dependent dehydrogenase (short-subunit alcohol dehydrogenase family)
MRVDGKLALVTGAARGIGCAIAVELARGGAGGVAIADLDADKAAETAAIVTAHGCPAHVIQVDLRDPVQVERMANDAAEALGGLDVLVNNAAVIEGMLTRSSAFDTMPLDAWETIYEVNLRAVWLAMRFAAPHLRASERGPSIVNASSVSGLVGYPRAPAYCATKGAVIQLTKAAAIDLAPIRCNCFCPGTTETSMVRELFARARDPDAARRTLMAPLLAGRIGQPEDIARLACFLASDDAAFVTGAVLVVDGGLTAATGQPRFPAED